MSDQYSDDINLNTQVETTEENKDSKKRHYNAFLLLLRILMTGTAGWKELRRSRMTPEQTASRCFYPILAVVSACRFSDWFYLPEFNLSATLISAVSVFVSFFFGYFAIQAICKAVFPFAVKSKTETPYFKLLVQYSLASLALFWIPAEILPVLEPITVFLPIWTAFIITRGLRFLRLPQNYVNRCTVIIVLTVIVIPYLFMWISDKIFF